MKFFLFALLICTGFSSHAQSFLKVAVRNEETHELLNSATVVVQPLNKAKATDSLGIAGFNLPYGNYELTVSYVGYRAARQKIVLSGSLNITILLEADNEDYNPDVIITTTRTDRSVRNTPTRVEAITGGEIAENISMRPGEIKMLLNESTGIITQPTSAVSGTADLRLQQLDGRYTQILRDGLPLYSGLSEGLSLVQIAPLDLKQVEIIKGPASTLFGGGAITGLINLISKTPTDKKELSLIANGSSAKALDLSSFYSQRFKKIGLSIFASRNSNGAYDPSSTGLTAIPKFQRYTISPKLFFFGNKTTASAGFSYIKEDRLGGNINYINQGVPGYFEKNNSGRFTTQLSIIHHFKNNAVLTVKNSYNHFNRTLSLPSYSFRGLQQSSFSEISLNTGNSMSQWVAGGNIYVDDFSEQSHSVSVPRSYQNLTTGVFVQHTWLPVKFINIESGVRGDYTYPFRFVLLPRVSALFNFSGNITSRISGGFGYKLPIIFTEQSEELYYKNILPVNKNATEYEKSEGGTIDFMYRTSLGDIGLFINPLFFYTRINHPQVMQPTANGQNQFLNADGFTDSKGLDISFRLSMDEIKFYTGYTYTIVANHFNGTKTIYPLAPKNKLHFDLVYELEGKLRIALESYYTGRQQLSDGTVGRKYWLTGALIEKTFKHFSVFVNGEDLNNVRQTKWESIYTGTINQPDFKDIYAPLEGRTVNGGIKVSIL